MPKLVWKLDHITQKIEKKPAIEAFYEVIESKSSKNLQKREFKNSIYKVLLSFLENNGSGKKMYNF